MILVDLGANLDHPEHGSPPRTLQAALGALCGKGCETLSRSGWWETEPVPRSDQPWYVNAVALIRTALPPQMLLHVLQAVETAFGRVRSVPNAPRIIDLDLLDYDGLICSTPELVLPHPRLHDRLFVLKPLAEVAPEWRHPVLGCGADELATRAPSAQTARLLGR